MDRKQKWKIVVFCGYLKNYTEQVKELKNA